MAAEQPGWSVRCLPPRRLGRHPSSREEGTRNLETRLLKLAAFFPALSLRTKLALVALVLLALPWAGYEYVREMERFLLEGEEQALLATARAVATALHDRPGLMRARPPRDDDLLREANLVVDEGTITSHVKRIRRKFTAVDPAFEQIDTVYGMGYRWKA